VVDLEKTLNCSGILQRVVSLEGCEVLDSLGGILWKVFHLTRR
jgi:hypothetical protein